MAALSFPCLAGGRYAVDWQKLDSEILEHYRALIRIDTSNPPGNETRAVDYLKRVLDGEGVPYRVLAQDPNRANLVARIRGNGSKRPIAILGHTDVVGVQRDRWPVDPFAALLKDGYVWGRGSSDDKSHVAADLAVILELKRLNVALDRDIIFIAESGEEGTTGPGIDYLVQEHWPDIAAEYALAEGGFVLMKDGAARFVEITTTEKTPRTTRLIAHGTAGHGSRPTRDNAIVHLAAALAKFAEWQPPMRLNETTRTYFERLARISPPEAAYRYNHVADPRESAAAQRYLAEHQPSQYSMLRTSIVPTIIRGGFRSNVIPSEAEATLDIRALPDEDISRIYEEMRRVINDPAIEIVPVDREHPRPASPSSSLRSEMFYALERTQKRMYPRAITIPAMLTGATDMAQLRAKGVQAYGFGPEAEESEMRSHGAHSDAERLAETSVSRMAQFLWETLLDVAASR